MARSQRDLALEQRWREHVANWQTSGLSIREFCSQHDLIETAFHFWKRATRSPSADCELGFCMANPFGD